MWGHIKKNAESENCVNQGFFVVLNGKKLRQNNKPRKIEKIPEIETAEIEECL